MSGELIVLVDVDTFELDRLTVHKETASDNLQTAESDVGFGVFPLNA